MAGESGGATESTRLSSIAARQTSKQSRSEPAEPEGNIMGRIVVGVDGSEGSRRALLWAAKEASLRGAALEVIHTYEHEPAWADYAYDETMSAEVWETVREDIEAAARNAAVYAQALVEKMIEQLDQVEVEGSAIESRHPAQTLVEHSRDADMLVVGSRGRGGFKSLMLGSISQQCAHHAECPVVIIRSTVERRSERAERADP